MNRKNLACAVLATVNLTATLILWRQAREVDQQLELRPPSLEIRCFEGELPTFSFLLHNGGSRPMYLYQATPSCNCIKLEVATQIASPYQAIPIRGVFDSREQLGESTRFLKLEAGDKEIKRLQLPLHVSVSGLLDRQPPKVDFGTVRAGSKVEQKIRLQWLQPGYVISGARTSNPDLSPHLEPGGCRIVWHPTHGGHVEAEVFLELQGSRPVLLAIHVTGRVPL